MVKIFSNDGCFFGLKLHTVSFQVVSCRAMNAGVVIYYTNGFLKNDFDILPCNMGYRLCEGGELLDRILAR